MRVGKLHVEEEVGWWHGHPIGLEATSCQISLKVEVGVILCLCLHGAMVYIALQGLILIDIWVR